ncbi:MULTISPECIES: hypothetical protein [Pseudovibrio]|uniref:hypothetical protein n=1 Tax=Stappiaceae TaxID=2821832 RepID=UPI002366E191|nr:MULTISPECIES: hypothetical protein [Pseudovibrio]MDD7908991.1 hypothetical protein [Pseudovibrio exalbescens]MDX5593688.1 hypothetical protein [Pseudovibrio sp. SPO723]
MFKVLLTGIWICGVTLFAGYATALWKTQNDPMMQKEAHLEGLDYQKTQPINVPVLEDGQIYGYIIAQFVFTIDADTLDKLAVPPHAFVVDEAFRLIYSRADKHFAQLQRTELKDITEEIKAKVNARFGVGIIQDVLVQEFAFHIPRDVEQPTDDERGLSDNS